MLGVLTRGVVIDPAVTDGTVAVGTPTDGTETAGTDTVGTDTVGTDAAAEAVGRPVATIAAAATDTAPHTGRTVRRQRLTTLTTAPSLSSREPRVGEYTDPRRPPTGHTRPCSGREPLRRSGALAGDDALEGGHDVRVELLSGAATQLDHRGGFAHRGPIRARGGHRVVGIA